MWPKGARWSYAQRSRGTWAITRRWLMPCVNMRLKCRRSIRVKNGKLPDWRRFEHDDYLPTTLPIASVTTTHLNRWKSERLKAVSAGSVLREVSLLGSFFTHARKEWGEGGSQMARYPMSARRNSRDTISALSHITKFAAYRLTGCFVSGAWLDAPNKLFAKCMLYPRASRPRANICRICRNDFRQ